MYAIYRNSRRSGKALFNSYEEARKRARKLARKWLSEAHPYRPAITYTPDGSQPVLRETPYSVRKVA